MLIMINICVLVICALSVNLIAAFYWDGRSLWKKIFVPLDEQAYVEVFPAKTIHI